MNRRGNDMDMPITKGMALRKKMGLHGRVNADELAERLALTIEAYPFKDIEELKVGDTIILAERLDSRQRRWAIAHGIGHYALHEGNQMWCRAQTLLAPRQERQAEDFAWGLLVDLEEAWANGSMELSQLSMYFGVPPEVARCRLRRG